ncbi:MAG: spore cortex biosynthesis protein YabQ [Clostridiales bacterium]|jgi:hypothetical protein|nr:spore cortex biosynthesis protein YabQ [Clostridiales bacterium]
MFLTSGQFFVFSWYVFIGAVIGVLYELFYAARVLCGRGLPVTVISDILFAGAAGIVFIFLSGFAAFGELRLYCILAAAAGLIIELLALHQGVAFLTKLMYNKLNGAYKNIVIGLKRFFAVRKDTSGGPDKKARARTGKGLWNKKQSTKK